MINQIKVDVDCCVGVCGTCIVLKEQVTLRETQDALLRDNLESSATVINLGNIDD